MTAVTPFEKGGAWGFGKIRGVWDHYFALRGATQQNEELRNENDVLKLEISQLQSKAAEGDRLAALLNFRQSRLKVPMVMARVIGASASSASHTVEIDRGERDGIRRNMAVITPDGAVGKIIECYRDTAQVLLLNDKDGGAGAMLVGSRIQSPVKGTGEPMLSMSYVAAEETVNAGEKIVTSGMDKIFPRDVPIGTVLDVKQGNPFKQIRVRPAARLDRLEEVIVLLTQESVNFKNDADEQGAQPAAGNSTPAAAGKPAAEKP
jgi:rod shape-determining protein MreC